MVERASVLKTGDIITKKNLQDALYPPDLDMAAESGAAFMAAAGEGTPDRGPVSEPEKLRQALEQCNGNRTRAARLLGMDRSTLWRKMQKYQM